MTQVYKTQFDKFIAQAMSEVDPHRLPPHQLRKVLDFIYDGNISAYDLMLNIHHNYLRAHKIFLWCVKNGVRGQKFVEYFQNESGDEDGGGILSGVTLILGRIDGVKYSRLNVKELR